MDEYNDPDTVRLGENFFSKSGMDSPKMTHNSQRTMSLCIDPAQGVKTVVSRNISSPPSMPGTSQKRFSLRSSLKRLTGSSVGLRSDSMRSQKLARCDDTILETNEMPSRNNLEGSASSEEGQSEPRIPVEVEGGEKEDLVKKNLHTGREQENQINFWLFYFKECGWTLILVFSLSSCFYQSLKIYSDMWLNEVVEETSDVKEVRKSLLIRYL